MPCRATQDGQVMVESSDKMWSTGRENGKPCQYSCGKNPMNGSKRQKNITSEDEPPQSEGVQYATGEEGRAIHNTNSSRKDEAAGPKQKSQMRRANSLGKTLVLGKIKGRRKG